MGSSFSLRSMTRLGMYKAQGIEKERDVTVTELISITKLETDFNITAQSLNITQNEFETHTNYMNLTIHQYTNITNGTYNA
jgi:hypothetical protein